MKQFILRQEPDEGGLVHLSGKDFHYLARIRRMRRGDTLECRLPSGKTALLRIGGTENATISAECVRVDAGPRQNLIPPIILFQSMAKGSKMDTVVRQAGGTGVTEIVPFYSEHSVPRPRSGAEAASRTERWRRILIEVRQQSGYSCQSSAARHGRTFYLLEAAQIGARDGARPACA
jgi:16S rRNA (uracil1498-N3)-methyltransferase